MRKKVVISTITLAVLFMVGVFYLRHRAGAPLPVAQSSKPVVTPSARSSQTVVVSGTRAIRPQTEVVFSDRHQTDVTLPIIRMIIDVKADTLSRQNAIRALPRDLIPEYRKDLTDFLTARHAEDDSQTGHVLKNDIMDALVGQKTPGRGLLDLFSGIYHDKTQNIVIRDYAMQHLALLSERLDSPTVWDPSLVQAQQKLIQDTLWQCAEERGSSISGTALLALTRISETHSEVDRIRLGQAAIAMTDVEVDEAARVTAYQICARLQVSSALPLAITAAQSDSSSIVRTSAIGALGLFGNAGQLPILNQIAEHNARFKPVAMLAMKKIQERTQ